MSPNSKRFMILPLLSMMLSILMIGCGGGETATEVLPEPIQISESDWANFLPKSSSKISIRTNVRANSFLDISISGQSLSNAPHWQIQIDTDNNPKTGFQYNQEAWSAQSGVDYLIENGALYKSTANGSEWGWKYLGDVKLTNGDQIKFSLNLNSLETNLCRQFNIGFIELDSNWSIKTFYPVANQLLKKTTEYCANTVKNHPPIISLNGVSPMRVPMDIQFTDPGATAKDVEDGDISSKVKLTFNNVDTSIAGSYLMTYEVTDSHGIKVKLDRHVYVESAATGSTIIIDGDIGDWTNIDALAQNQNGTLKVSDDKENIFIMIDSISLGENWQIFIDSDNRQDTGYELEQGGADYLISNSEFTHFSGDHQEKWAWSANSSQIRTSKTSSIVEVAIPKHSLQNMGKKLAIGFISLNSDWQDNYTLPNTLLVSYVLVNTQTPPLKLQKLLNDGELQRLYKLATNQKVDKNYFGINPMITKGNTLYLGIGSGLPAGLDGALLAIFKEGDSSLTALKSVNEQGVMTLAEYGDYIAVPGADPCCGDILNSSGHSGKYGNQWDWGNFYTINTTNHKVNKVRNLPNVVHGWGSWFDKDTNTLYYAGSGHLADTPDVNNATPSGLLFKTNDLGKAWVQVANRADGIGNYRTFDVLGIKNKLYVQYKDDIQGNCGVASSNNQGKTWSRIENLAVSCATRLYNVQENLVVISADGKSFMKIDSSGQPSSHDFSAKFSIVAYHTISQDSVGNIYIGTKDGRVMHTRDFNKWTELARVSDKSIGFNTLIYWKEKQWLVLGNWGDKANLWKMNIKNTDNKGLPDILE